MPLTEVLSRNWWAILIRGIAAMLFGFLALIWPQGTLLVLVLLFGAYALVDGVFAIAAALRGTRPHGSGWLLIEGGIGVIIGLVTFFVPAITGLVLLYFIAAWAILTGVAEIAQAILLRRSLSHEWLLIVSGALSVVLGVFLMIFPGAGALGLVWVIGLYALAFGALLIGLSLRLRQRYHSLNSTGATTQRSSGMARSV